MMHKAQEQNFWPGYLDAMINVMLNLLFLVAIFTMGLVALNMQTTVQMNKVNDLQEPDEGVTRRLGQQAQEIITQLDIDPDKKKAILDKLPGLNIAELLAKREELDRQRHLQAQQQPPTMSKAEQRAAVDELRRKADELDVQIREARLAVVQERARQQTALQSKDLSSSGLVTNSGPVMEFRTAMNAEQTTLRSANASKAGGMRQALVRSANLRPQAIWEFPPNDFVWEQTRALPEGFSSADKSANWHLLGFVDVSNARVRRETFARLQAVRDVLIERGFAKERMRLELRAIDESWGLDEQAYRLIFMLPQS